MIRTAIAISLLLSAPTYAQETAEQILESMAAQLKSLKSFSVHMEKTFDDMMVDGAKIQFAGAVDLSVRKPDGIHMFYGDDLSAKELWYDGKTFTLHDHLKKVYMSVDAKPTMREALTELREEYGIVLPLMALLRGKPAEDYGAGVTVRRYLGIHDVEGIPCHHLLFRGDEVDWQLWIEDGDMPLLRKVAVTYKLLEGSPQDVGVLTEWELNPKFKDAVFEAAVPETSVRAEAIKKREVRD